MNIYKRLRESGMGTCEALWVSTTPLIVASLPLLYSIYKSDFSVHPYESSITLGYALGGGAILGALTFFGCMSITAANQAYQIGHKNEDLEGKITND